jgi:hypothetical protein
LENREGKKAYDAIEVMRREVKEDQAALAELEAGWITVMEDVREGEESEEDDSGSGSGSESEGESESVEGESESGSDEDEDEDVIME